MAVENPAAGPIPMAANPLDRYVSEYLEEHGQRSRETKNKLENLPKQDGSRTDRDETSVYLHADSLAGAQTLLSPQVKLGQRLSLEEFPYALRKLKASEVEDFLCVYGMGMKEFSTTDWIRIDRDWRGT